jgi:DNA-binding CsgD family transcriptional regulator
VDRDVLERAVSAMLYTVSKEERRIILLSLLREELSLPETVMGRPKLTTLSGLQKETLTLWQQGKSAIEIAKERGRSRNAVYSALSECAEKYAHLNEKRATGYEWLRGIDVSEKGNGDND